MSASRELGHRARRKIQNDDNNQRLKSTTTKSKGYMNGQRKLVYILTLGFVVYLLIWIRTVWNLEANLESDLSVVQSNLQKFTKNNTKTSDKENPYTAAALERNPYLGWQPTLVTSPLGSSFSWRQCFNATLKSNGTDQPAGCRENPNELGDAPTVEENWIPDVTMIRTMAKYGKAINGNSFPPPLSEELCGDINETGGEKGDSNKLSLTETMIRTTGTLTSDVVSITPSNHYGAPPSIQNGTIDVPAPKIMCLIYTMADAHANRIRAILETWAGGCDGFLAFSTESDPRLPAISLKHDGPEEYENMWQKVRSIWKFVGANYLEEFDWFYIGGDDLYVMPHNLKTYLASLVYKDGTDPKTKEYYIGRRFNREKFNGGYPKSHPLAFGPYNCGGAGYALSQATLRTFLANIDDVKHCSADIRTSMEDVMVAKCLHHLGIHYTDTRDAKGRERFHNFDPAFLFNYKPTSGGWYEKYNKEWGLLFGKDCCAPDSVSFHYIKQVSMVRHIHALVDFCDVAA